MNMLDTKTQQKYLRILSNEKTLKLDAQDAIQLISESEKFKDLEDQVGNTINADSILSLCTGKVIMHLFKIWHLDNKQIIYWCPCSLEDMAAIAGATDFVNGSYKNVQWIPRNKQTSFLGKDIKRAVENSELNPILKDFSDRYVETEHPLADNMFYTMYMKGRCSDSKQIFSCARNTSLSPRPIKNDDTK